MMQLTSDTFIKYTTAVLSLTAVYFPWCSYCTQFKHRPFSSHTKHRQSSCTVTHFPVQKARCSFTTLTPINHSVWLCVQREDQKRHFSDHFPVYLYLFCNYVVCSVTSGPGSPCWSAAYNFSVNRRRTRSIDTDALLCRSNSIVFSKVPLLTWTSIQSDLIPSDLCVHSFKKSKSITKHEKNYILHWNIFTHHEIGQI